MTDEAKGPRYGDIAAAPLVNHSAHRRHEDDRWTCWIERKDGQQIGEVYGDTGPEANANARKIVALPKLIEALKEVEWGGGCLDEFDHLRACCPACQNTPQEGHLASCSLQAALSALEVPHE